MVREFSDFVEVPLFIVVELAEYVGSIEVFELVNRVVGVGKDSYFFLEAGDNNQSKYLFESLFIW